MMKMTITEPAMILATVNFCMDYTDQEHDYTFVVAYFFFTSTL